MGRACGTHGRQDRRIEGFSGQNVGKETTCKTDLDGRIILKLICKKWDGAWTGLIWFWIGTGVMHLGMR
jgi:hypothetical protein